MKKRLAVLVLILSFALSFVWSASVSFVYGNTVSSIDFEEFPKVGTVFKDEKNNVLIVNSSSEKAVVFDKISTRSTVEVGSELTNCSSQQLVFLRTSMNHTSIGYSRSTAFYPLRPVVLAGFAYSLTSKSYDGLYLTAGLESDVVLSKLWDTSFTLIEDGGVIGWCTAGILVKNGVSFVGSYGLAYRHYIGDIRWEAGYQWLQSSDLKYSSGFLGVGMSL